MLNKRTFLAGTICHTQAWYTARATGSTIGPAEEWQFYNGNEAQRIAREQLGPGLLLLQPYSEAASAKTVSAVSDPENNLLFEATFAANGMVARADALRRIGDDWELIEIKAATNPSDGKIESEYLDDLAHTTMVITLAGHSPLRSLLMLLNREYRIDGSVPCFVELDLTEQIRERTAILTAQAVGIVAAVRSAERPEPTLIHDCKKCDFFATECVGQGVDDSILLIPRLLSSQFDKLQPHSRLSQLPHDVKLSPTQQPFLEAWRRGVPTIGREVLARELDAVVYPRYYLDFEAVSPAIPWFGECAPYQVLPFQYSLHLRSAAGAELQHFELLADHATDWRRDFVESLLRALGSHGSIMVYSHYEKTQLRAMAETFPDLAQQIGTVIARLVDLEKAVREGYVHPDFRGRTSIKVVLPVVSPGLEYDALTVGDGLAAAGLFGLMRVGARSPESWGAHRADLLAYCELDTLAMVRVHEALEAVRG